MSQKAKKRLGRNNMDTIKLARKERKLNPIKDYVLPKTDHIIRKLPASFNFIHIKAAHHLLNSFIYPDVFHELTDWARR